MSKIVYGYKSLFTKFTLVFTGAVLLLALNFGIFVVFIKYPQRRWYFVVGLLFLWWIFWRMRRVQKKLHYIFDKGNITIVLPSWKKFVLEKKHIKKTKKVQSGAWWSPWWISYIPRKKEFYFTTSTQHLLKIWMDDGRVIVISPKQYE